MHRDSDSIPILHTVRRRSRDIYLYHERQANVELRVHELEAVLPPEYRCVEWPGLIFSFPDRCREMALSSMTSKFSAVAIV